MAGRGTLISVVGIAAAVAAVVTANGNAAVPPGEGHVRAALAVTAPGPSASARPAVRAGGPTAPSKAGRERAAADARSVVQRDRTAVRGGPDEKYTVRSVLVDDDGARHVRMDRTYRGLAVLGGDFVVHAHADGRLRGTTVAQERVVDVSTKPAISAERAGVVAAAAFKDPVGKSTSTLVIDAAAGVPVLAWRVLVQGAARKARSVEYVVDATNGAVRRAVAAVRTAANDGTGHGLHSGDVRLSTTLRDGSYELVDEDRGGSETRDGKNLYSPALSETAAFTDKDNVWGDGTLADPATLAVDVHHGVQQTWDYFLRAHGRTGVADDGRGTLAIVHDRASDQNAHWADACFCMRFGAGGPQIKPFTAQDIVAHEWSHGVTGATAKLDYYAQSGALDEATSDIFGSLVEFAADNPADPPDYLIGEMLDDGGDGRPLRYMDDPGRDGYSVGCWDGGGDDSIDVHYLSGVPNKFFYVLAEGSGKSAWGEAKLCAGAAPVAGIGRDEAGAVWYRALTRYMVSTTDFRRAREATLRSAEDLHGAGSAEYAAVDAAWAAVHVDGTDPASRRPAVVQPPDRTDRVGEPVRLQIEATDPQGDPLRFTAEGLPKGLTVTVDGLITGTLTEDRRSDPKITVTDPDGYAATATFRWTVQGPPVIEDPGPQRHGFDDYVQLFLHAKDRDVVTWTVTDLPDGLTHDDGYISGSPTRAGTFEVAVTATDSDGLSSSLTFVWTIVASEPPGPPTYVYGFWTGADVQVMWGWPDGDPGSLTGYEVTIAPDGPTVMVEDGWTTSTEIHGLDPAKAYTVSVVAVNPGGRSTPTTGDVIPE